MLLVILYLGAIISANLLVAEFGPSISVLNAFLFIGLDLTARDGLHEKWGNNYLWVKMLALITVGSVLSYALNYKTASIAIASFVAFVGTGIVDAIIYQLLKKRLRFVKINTSNIVSAGVDSILFPVLAFGFPVLWAIVLGQFLAKVLGGFIWSLILVKLNGLEST